MTFAVNTEDPEVSQELTELGVRALPFTIIEDEKTRTKEEIVGFEQKKFENIYFYKADFIGFIFVSNYFDQFT
ncbi:hypothetical protein Q8G35_15925 [Peribacillus simplex]|uniref:Uncharacterized protein n=2 Tax=Peribacillus TaxID=2675229 RepID=A0AA90PI48_9BACI|nr:MULTISPECIES: hypothetical protein [Peribacillus]MDP1419838.1 hypothetical protein [Peribacillus simplex]MDP1454067.1 hypothetical protein [Peribacillus frigoritolerans]